MSPAAAKQQLRLDALTRRRVLSHELKYQYSRSIERHLLSHLRHNAPENHHLLAYRSLPDEVDTRLIFATPPCQIYAPRMHGRDDMHWFGITGSTEWIKGAFGIEEPASGHDWADEESPAILLCPLVGFDRSGNRLGMGKGCFDRWLAKHQQRITSIIGLAFSCQEIASIPSESHDVPLHTIITEKEVISCQKL
ncbi:MAG: 5-formyltetrahydrofolate cyclo-ligase [Mariprofundaceae bacterium]|nr:5-formyltetrahydrofolate cyclo-ligase [Mariprofundaceae bacterium]